MMLTWGFNLVKVTNKLCIFEVTVSLMKITFIFFPVGKDC
jgi:hypothetical protein